LSMDTARAELEVPKSIAQKSAGCVEVLLMGGGIIHQI
jgi:hypothetical protein